MCFPSNSHSAKWIFKAFENLLICSMSKRTREMNFKIFTTFKFFLHTPNREKTGCQNVMNNLDV